MLIVFLVVFITLFIIGFCDDDWDSPLTAIGAFLGVLCIIAMCVLGGILSGAMIIDKKIEMYQTENKEIQQEVSIIIKDYMNWEQETYELFKNESPTILIELYPELKSSELVNRQITLYIENNQQIKKFKLEKLNYKPIRFWIYFGR